MLNIFLARKPLPNYRLVPPAEGELEKIIVKTDVRETTGTVPRKVADIRVIDSENQTIRLRRDSAEYYLRPEPVRVVHCTTGQTSSEPGSTAYIGVHWDP